MDNLRKNLIKSLDEKILQLSNPDFSIDSEDDYDGEKGSEDLLEAKVARNSLGDSEETVTS